MYPHELHNILDDAYKIRPWLDNLPYGQGNRIVGEHQHYLAAIDRSLKEPPAPFAVRTAITRVDEIGANIRLLDKLALAHSEYEMRGADEAIARGEDLDPTEEQLYDQMNDSYQGLVEKTRSLMDATNHLQLLTAGVASYAEFLSLDARHHIGPAKTETMRRISCNPMLMHARNIDEYRSWRSHKPQDASITNEALAASQELRQALTEFETHLGERDDSDPGCSFIRSTMLPRLRDDLDLLDASLGYLGTEIEALIKASPNRQPVFQQVQTTQAVPIDLIKAREAALNDPGSNVVSLFGGSKAKG